MMLALLTAGVAEASAACNGLRTTITGTSAGETINGTSKADVIEALGGDDVINGLGSNDTICGGDGYDTLRGGAGDDWMDGQGGADVVDYGPIGSAVTLNLANGTASSTTDGNDTLYGTEDAYGSGYADTLTGSLWNNALYGLGGDDTITSAAGADWVQGGDGDDTINGGTENDNLRGELGNDTITFSDAAAAITVNLATTTGQVTGQGTDTILTFEHIIGSAYNDSLTGSSGANSIDGRAGDDTLLGAAGDDALTGGDGADTIGGEAGNDSVTGGLGVDRASFASAAGAVTVDLALTTAQTTGDGSDTITQVEGATGSAFADTISGDGADNPLTGGAGNDTLTGAGGNDTVDGGDGDDVLKGGLGDDTLTGGAGVDKADYSAAGVRIVLNLSLTGAQATGEGSDTVSGIENAASGIGNGDFLVGDAGPNTLWAGSGDDELRGGAGNDTLYTEAGVDTLVGGAGDDVLDGGPDADAIEYGFSPGGVTVNLAAGTATGEGTDTITAVEDIYGSPFNDAITGSPNNNYLAGVDGDDTISGAGGNDLLQGGAGADTLNPGDGQDNAQGGAGADTINSRDLNADSISCGSEADTVASDPLDISINADCETVTSVHAIRMSGPDDAFTLRADGNIPLTAEDAVNGGARVDRVQFQKRLGTSGGWEDVGSPDTAAPWGYDLASSTLADGDYQFRALAYDSPTGGASLGSDASRTVNITRDTVAISQPTDVAAKLVGDQAVVSWTTSTDAAIVGYVVERRTTSPLGEWEHVGRTTPSGSSGTSSAGTMEVLAAGTTATISDSTPRGGKAYEYRVSSVGKEGSTAAKSDAPTGVPVGGNPRPLLGLEHFWTYHVENLGGDWRSYTNVAGGNHTVQGRLVSEPGRGLATNVWLTYNVQDIESTDKPQALNSILGPNWTLSISDLDSDHALGAHPVQGVATDPLKVNSGSDVILRDGDGTKHTFTRVYDANNVFTGKYQAPAGVFVYLRDRTVTGENADGVAGAHFKATRPDRVTSYYDLYGRLLATRDREGQGLTFNYTCIGVNDTNGSIDVPQNPKDPSLPVRCVDYSPAPGRAKRWRMTGVTDAGGETVALAYDADGHLQTITDHLGTQTRIAYDTKQNGYRLLNVTQGYGVAGEARTSSFGYNNANDPATKAHDERYRLIDVTDARGKTTHIDYVTQLDAAELPRVSKIIDRRDNALANGKHTAFAYPLDANNQLAGTTTISDELGHATTYTWQTGAGDTAGRVTKQVDANNVTHRVVWSAGNTVSQLDELNPADQSVHASWTYTHDPKTGYVTSATEPERPATTVTYTNTDLVAGSTLDDGHVADIATVTSPRGTRTTADPDDFQTTFAYGAAPTYRLTSVSAPINAASGDSADLATTSMEYYANGDIKSQTDPRGYTTGYSSYDANGVARCIHKRVWGAAAFSPKDQLCTIPSPDEPYTAVDTQLKVDAHGDVTCADDRREVTNTGERDTGPACTSATTNKVFQTFAYNSHSNVLTATQPWDHTKRRASRYTYDLNANPTQVVNNIGYTPNTSTPQAPDADTPGVTTTTAYDDNDMTTQTLLPANDAAGSERKSTVAYDVAERVTSQTAPQGNATATAGDYTTSYGYDNGGRLTQVKDAEGRLSCSYYDAYNNLTKQSTPKALGAGVTACPDPNNAPTTFVTARVYNLAHQVTKVINERGKPTTFTYDDEGNRASVTDALGHTTDFLHDPRGEALKTTLPGFGICSDAAGDVSASVCSGTAQHRPVMQYIYDKNGNIDRQINPRRVETQTGTSHFTDYTYDAYNRPTRTKLPVVGAASQDLYLHTQYDALGRVAKTSMQTETPDATLVNDNYKTVFSYFPDGAVATKNDNPNDHVVSYTYEVNGRPDTRREHAKDTVFDYWPDSSLKSRDVDPTTTTIPVAAFDYDRSGQITTISEGSPVTKTLTINNRDHTGLPLQATGFDGRQATYTYDRNQNLTSRAFANKLLNISYETQSPTQSPSDLIAKLELGPTDTTQVRQLAASFSYDANSRLTTTQRLKSDQTVSSTTNYAFNPAGLKERVDTARSGTSCDAAGAVCMQDFKYTFDAGGNARKIEQRLLKRGETTAAAATERLYTYDAKDRLNTDKIGDTLRQYDYDPNGRLDYIDTLGNTDYEDYKYGTAANPGQMTSIEVSKSGSLATQTNTYGDALDGMRGNLTRTVRSDGQVSTSIDYRYDRINRLVQTKFTEVDGDVSTKQITYDALNRRASETTTKAGVANKELAYAYASLNETPAGETNTDADNPSERWMLDDPAGQALAELRASGTSTSDRYMLADHLGSVVSVLGTDSVVKTTFDFDSYGARVQDDVDKCAPLGTQPDPGQMSCDEDTKQQDSEQKERIASPYQFTGKRYDSIGNTTHHGARDYNPTLRTWIQTDQYLDPLADLGLSADPATGDRTMYAGGNPVNMIDEDGHRFTTGSCYGDDSCQEHQWMPFPDGSVWRGERGDGTCNCTSMTKPSTSSSSSYVRYDGQTIRTSASGVSTATMALRLRNMFSSFLRPHQSVEGSDDSCKWCPSAVLKAAEEKAHYTLAAASRKGQKIPRPVWMGAKGIPVVGSGFACLQGATVGGKEGCASVAAADFYGDALGASGGCAAGGAMGGLVTSFTGPGVAAGAGAGCAGGAVVGGVAGGTYLSEQAMDEYE